MSCQEQPSQDQAKCSLLDFVATHWQWSEAGIETIRAACQRERTMYESAENDLPLDVCPLAVNGIVWAFHDVRQRQKGDTYPELHGR